MADSPNLTGDEAKFYDWIEDVCAEREAMLKAEEGYLNRVKAVEADNLELLKAFDNLKKENDQLRKKYEPSETVDAYMEPYSEIYKERHSLLDKVQGYKQRITYLETELSSLLTRYNKVDSRHNETVCQAKKHNSYVVVTGKEDRERLQKEIGALRLKLWQLHQDNYKQGEIIQELLKRTEDQQQRSIIKGKAKEWSQYLKGVQENAKIASRPSLLSLSAYINDLNLIENIPKSVKNMNDISQIESKDRRQKLPAIRTDFAPSGLLFGLSYNSLRRRRLRHITSKRSMEISMPPDSSLL